MFRRALTWLGYPVAMGGAVAFSLWGLERGLPAWSIGILVVIACAFMVEVLERVIPYSSTWAKPRGDVKTDLWHFALSNRAFDVGAIAAIAIVAPLGIWMSHRIGSPLWPHHWPLVVQAILALALVELPWYWIHRVEHTWHPLWRVHSVHHSAERLYWWNVARNHPIDNLISAAASMALVAFLGVGEGALAIVAAFSGANAMLQHSNADLRTGPIDWFLNTARVHRWHHSVNVDEANANYCPTLTLWDWVFRTRRFDPAATPSERVGIDHEFPGGYVAQLRAPFDARLWRT